MREKAREIQPQVLIAETISNPLLKVCDIEACAEIAHENGARLIIDNTFATPYLRQPLKLGADIVVHSATKYLGGHADAMGGWLFRATRWTVRRSVSVMKLVGGVLGVWDAHEILRGLKTLAVRMDRQCENARALAGHLQGTSSVSLAFIIRGLARLVSIELRDDTKEAAFRFMDRVEVDMFVRRVLVMFLRACCIPRRLRTAICFRREDRNGELSMDSCASPLGSRRSTTSLPISNKRYPRMISMFANIYLIEIREHGVRDYPYECCGLLLGRYEADGEGCYRDVSDLECARRECEAKPVFDPAGRADAW